MKVLVLSDSHGNIANMVKAVEQESPRLILHLGDGWRDVAKLQGLFPDIPIEQVPGNCDVAPHEADERLLFLEDYRVLLCHGHTYLVKKSLLNARAAAKEQNLDLFLFGHTHRPLISHRGQTWFINPGSIGKSDPPTYAVITIAAGKIDLRIAELS